MKKISKTLVFFGSGSVAAKSLDFLCTNFRIETVFTKFLKDDKNPVIDIAERHNLPIVFANNKSELLCEFDKCTTKSSLGVVIDYGIIIEQTIINAFEKGIINSHFSLLPEWRGADPITHALLSGKAYTGVSVMVINNLLDEGEILATKRVDISTDDDNLSLSTKLIDTSNNLLLRNLPSYLTKSHQASPQTTTAITYSKKIFKSDGLIDWQKPASVLEREVRAYRVWPGSFTNFGGLRVIIHQAQLDNQKLKAGQLFLTQEGEIIVGCRVGSLKLVKLQPIGKKAMLSKDFINGYKKYLLEYGDKVMPC